jgi:murein DD-endopeptidase MepM/ murein hydrolase activator NlpD
MVEIGRSRVAKVLLSLFLVALVGTALPAAADPQDRLEDIRQRQEEVDARIDALDSRSDELLGRIGDLDKKREKVDRRVDHLDAELHDLALQIDEVRDDLADAQHRISLLEKELQEILADLQARTEVYTGRAVAIYKAGPGMYVDGLLDSEDFSDLFDRLAYYRASVDADAELIAEIQVLRDQTTTRREQVEAERARIAKAKLRLEQDKARLAEARNEQAVVLAEREAVLSEKEAILAEVESRKSSAKEIYEQLEQDAAEIQNLLASSGSSSGGVFPTGGGQLAWPAAGPVTSPYGWRTHPIFGDQRLHAGIDIGASYGAPVVAASDGTVVYVGAMSGYGNVVVVDHGGGLSTTYNHLSAFHVGSGQSVSRGSQVGAVGCTGYCTGPHLHFEVRVNGSPVDPMPYLR